MFFTSQLQMHKNTMLGFELHTSKQAKYWKSPPQAVRYTVTAAVMSLKSNAFFFFFFFVIEKSSSRVTSNKTQVHNIKIFY